MLYLFSCAAHGKPIERQIENVDEVLALAKKHSCYYMIAEILLKNNYPLSEEVKADMVNKFQIGFAHNVVKLNSMIWLMNKLEEKSIQAVVLKGFSVAFYYASPMSRISSDIDLLINPEDEEKTTEVLISEGYELIEARREFEHHSAFRHPVFGLVELHIRMFEEEISDVWFASDQGALKVDLKTCVLETEYGKFNVLDINSQILHIFFHLVKHFIIGGLSIRAMADFMFVAVVNKDKIDWKSFFKIVKSSKLDMLYDALVCFMIEYVGFSKEEAPDYKNVDREYIEYIYNDLLFGEWIGKAQKNSQLARKTLAQERAEKLELNFSLLTIPGSKKKKGLSRYIPSKASLYKNYSYCRSNRILLPIAFVHFFAQQILRRIFNIEKAKDRALRELVNKNDEHRLALLKEFKIINGDK